uniref:Uncharacterized protein n=1 Tax=Zea mays TaxID=4577 RepID=C0PJ06_MAIZE|nr:unknown [Zea mays]|eukprot:NP_001169891.1 uncharacterized protein LOC100383785 [Zea mays]
MLLSFPKTSRGALPFFPSAQKPLAVALFFHFLATRLLTHASTAPGAPAEQPMAYSRSFQPVPSDRAFSQWNSSDASLNHPCTLPLPVFSPTRRCSREPFPQRAGARPPWARDPSAVQQEVWCLPLPPIQRAPLVLVCFFFFCPAMDFLGTIPLIRVGGFGLKPA